MIEVVFIRKHATRFHKISLNQVLGKVQHKNTAYFLTLARKLPKPWTRSLAISQTNQKNIHYRVNNLYKYKFSLTNKISQFQTIVQQTYKSIITPWFLIMVQAQPPKFTIPIVFFSPTSLSSLNHTPITCQPNISHVQKPTYSWTIKQTNSLDISSSHVQQPNNPTAHSYSQHVKQTAILSSPLLQFTTEQSRNFHTQINHEFT